MNGFRERLIGALGLAALALAVLLAPGQSRLAANDTGGDNARRCWGGCVGGIPGTCDGSPDRCNCFKDAGTGAIRCPVI